MRDDLISRKAVLKLLYEIKGDSCIPKNYGTILDIIRNVRNIPTAFDKEKVIEELISEASRWHESGVKFKDENEKGVAAGFRLATHIVEKGGIE